MSLRCEDCGSHKIINTESYQAYFREGDYIRMRVIDVWNTTGIGVHKCFYASCSEISKSTVVRGESRLDAMKRLGESLKRIKHVELLGNKLEVSYE
jgi:hypothetical protein